jgi:peptidoglycan/xylan/chitin deacetylase (PgdA/CDA1 family)
MSLTILMYHSIADNPRDPHAVHPDRFEAQMAQLPGRHQTVLDLEQVISNRSNWRLQSGVSLTFDDGYQDFLLTAAPILRRNALSATVFVPTGLLGRRAIWDSYDQTKKLLDWDELGEVHRLGFSVASHSVSHPRLTECDDSKLDYELRASLDELRSRLPKVAPLLSYPGGYVGRREMLATQRAGYKGAVGVASRFTNHFWTSSYYLRRRRWEQ